MIDAAENDVGEHEVPWGSNDGPYVFGKVQLPYDTIPPHFYKGLAWCAMACGKWYRDAGGTDWKSVCSPSTALMAQYAKDHNLVGPPRPGAFIIWPGKHVEPGEENAPTHVRAALMGPSVVVPLRDDGTLALGTWQGIFLCEFDGPRERSVYVTALS